jgi:hypothetical protein
MFLDLSTSESGHQSQPSRGGRAPFFTQNFGGVVDEKAREGLGKIVVRDAVIPKERHQWTKQCLDRID